MSSNRLPALAKCVSPETCAQSAGCRQPRAAASCHPAHGGIGPGRAFRHDLPPPLQWVRIAPKPSCSPLPEGIEESPRSLVRFAPANHLARTDHSYRQTRDLEESRRRAEICCAVGRRAHVAGDTVCAEEQDREAESPITVISLEVSFQNLQESEGRPVHRTARSVSRHVAGRDMGNPAAESQFLFGELEPGQRVVTVKTMRGISECRFQFSLSDAVVRIHERVCAMRRTEQLTGCPSVPAPG